MNNSFPRILSLLRKEQKLSQKQAAKDLGISQALLSHYENGIRECGLEFLIKVSQYYNVSCDYMLGKTSNRSGSTVIFSDNEEKNEDVASENSSENAIYKAFRATMRISDKFDSPDLRNELTKYYKLIIYKTFRLLYSANLKNSQKIFSLDSKAYSSIVLSEMILTENRISHLAKGDNIDSLISAPKGTQPLLSAENITEDSEEYTQAIMHIIGEIEAT